jgi:dihydroxyacetone kinase DhaKLM complex PTS-EIIA-like component DhaM
MVGLVVVSHSERAARGIVEVASEMGGNARIEAVGGDPDGGIGTSMNDIREAIEEAVAGPGDSDDTGGGDDGGDGGVVVLVDLGSAVMNTEIAIEEVAVGAEADVGVEVEIADAPVLEGAVSAAVEAAGPKATVESVVNAAVEAREYRKL